MPGTLAYVAFIVLVVIPTAIALPTIPDRLADLRAGIRGVLYVPLLWAILFPVAALSLWIAQYVPILQWGWLGANIAVAPLADAGGGSGTGASIDWLYLGLFVPLVLLAFLVFNWYEEHALYRERYTGVFAWAALHLIMGIPIVTIVPLFAVGCGFKAIYDARGREVAYAAHFASNCGILALLVVSVIFG